MLLSGKFLIDGGCVCEKSKVSLNFIVKHLSKTMMGEMSSSSSSLFFEKSYKSFLLFFWVWCISFLWIKTSLLSFGLKNKHTKRNDWTKRMWYHVFLLYIIIKKKWKRFVFDMDAGLCCLRGWTRERRSDPCHTDKVSFVDFLIILLSRELIPLLFSVNIEFKQTTY